MKSPHDPPIPGELSYGEPHPAAHDAMAYLQSMSLSDLAAVEEAYASCSIEGNRLAEICSETLRRLKSGEPVSDRYLLGLAWSMVSISDEFRKKTAPDE